MKEYVKPVLLENMELAEGVYTASGSSCYSTTAVIHQRPQTGRGDYRIQVNGEHAAADDHHSQEQILTLHFNLPVEYKSSNGTLQSGDGTNCIEIKYVYHNNARENIGLGDVYVTADQGLAVSKAVLSCNYCCAGH